MQQIPYCIFENVSETSNSERIYVIRGDCLSLIPKHTYCNFHYVVDVGETRNTCFFRRSTIVLISDSKMCNRNEIKII